MKEAIQIVEEMKQLESQLVRLRAELLERQAVCNHVYVKDALMSTCSRCLKSESHYY